MIRVKRMLHSLDVLETLIDLFIWRSSPWENGHCESFNSRFRDELGRAGRHGGCRGSSAVTPSGLPRLCPGAACQDKWGSRACRLSPELAHPVQAVDKALVNLDSHGHFPCFVSRREEAGSRRQAARPVSGVPGLIVAIVQTGALAGRREGGFKAKRARASP